MFFNRYPYTDMNQINLDWIIGKMIELSANMRDFVNVQSIKYADPLQWDITAQYAQNTIVQDSTGNTYLSKKAVPVGIPLTNSDYWLKVADFSSTAEQIMSNIAAANDEASTTTSVNRETGTLVWLNNYLYEVIRDMNAGDQYIDDPGNNPNIKPVTVEEYINEADAVIKNAISDIKDDLDNEVSDREAADTTLQNNIDAEEREREAADTTLQDNIDAEAREREAADTTLQSDIINIQGQLRKFSGVYLDGTNGDDANDGLSPDAPMKTCNAALTKYRMGSVNLYFMYPGTYVASVAVEALQQLEFSNPLGVSGVVVEVRTYCETMRLKLGSNSDSVGMEFLLADYGTNPCNCRLECYKATIKGVFQPQACNIFLSQCDLYAKLTSSQGKLLIYNCTFRQAVSISYGYVRFNTGMKFMTDQDETGQALLYFNGCFVDFPNMTIDTADNHGTFTYGLLLSGGYISFASITSFNNTQAAMGTIRAFRGIISKGESYIDPITIPTINSVRYYNNNLQYYDGTSWVNIPTS